MAKRLTIKDIQKLTLALEAIPLPNRDKHFLLFSTNYHLDGPRDCKCKADKHTFSNK